jgi:hypothetical protein
MSMRRKLWAVCLVSLAVSILSPISSNAALIQKGAAPGAKWGRVDGGGPFTKACPAGYVVTGVAVANSESFGYTTGFSFTHALKSRIRVNWEQLHLPLLKSPTIQAMHRVFVLPVMCSLVFESCFVGIPITMLFTM